MTIETAPLGEVATIERATVQPDSIPDGETYVGLENITTEGSFSEVGKVAAGELKSGKFRFDDGHLLYGKLRPYLSKIAAPSFSGVCSTDILPLRAGPRVDRKYLLHFLRTPGMVGHASKLATGANLPRLSPKALAAFSVPLPPIEEQRRIAAVLDAADALRAKRRQAITNLDSLTQAIFIDMFGDDLVRSEARPLQEAFSEKPIFGTMEPGQAEGSWLDLRVANIQDGRLDLTDQKYVELDERHVARHSVRDGDLLLARAIATQEQLGKCIVVKPGERSWAFDSHLMRIRLDESKMLPEVLKAWLSSPFGRAAFLRVARRSSVQFNVNTKEMSRLPVPSLNIERQVKFRIAVDSQEAERNRMLQARGGLAALFGSLQQRAFRGEL